MISYPFVFCVVAISFAVVVSPNGLSPPTYWIATSASLSTYLIPAWYPAAKRLIVSFSNAPTNPY